MRLFLKIAVVLTLASTSAFAAWTRAGSGSLAWLHDVILLDENRGVAAGSGGAYLETSDGGKTWTKRAGVTTDNIRQIFFAGTLNGWLLCERDVYSRGGNSVSYLLKTTDGGANWTKVEFADLGRARITRIFFNSKGLGFAVGESGAMYGENEDGDWKRITTSLRYLLLDGEFFGPTGVLVGAGGSLMFSEDDGSGWTQANVFGDKNPKLNAVFLLDKRNGWAVGADGRIFQSINGGRMWRQQVSGVSQNLTDIAFKNTADGWAVGADGLVLRTRTGGNVWFPEDSGVRHNLDKIAVHGNRAVAVGFGGTILVYDENPQPERKQSKPVMLKRNF